MRCRELWSLSGRNCGVEIERIYVFTAVQNNIDGGHWSSVDGDEMSPTHREWVIKPTREKNRRFFSTVTYLVIQHDFHEIVDDVNVTVTIGAQESLLCFLHDVCS